MKREEKGTNEVTLVIKRPLPLVGMNGLDSDQPSAAFGLRGLTGPGDTRRHGKPGQLVGWSFSHGLTEATNLNLGRLFRIAGALVSLSLSYICFFCGLVGEAVRKCDGGHSVPGN